MDDDIPVTVRFRVECAKCGHTEDDTYEFDMQRTKAHPKEEDVPGKCPKCGAAVQMHLKQTQQRQFAPRGRLGRAFPNEHHRAST